MTEITMPKLGATMTQGEILSWKIKAGDTVKKGDIICEISSEKLSSEVESFYTGVIEEILVPEGGSAEVGAPIAMIKES